MLPYTVPQPPNHVSAEEVLDLDNPKPSQDAVLPCVAAIDFLAEVYARDGGVATAKAVALWRLLANEHDTIRKKSVSSKSPLRPPLLCLLTPLSARYWEYRIKDALATKTA